MTTRELTTIDAGALVGQDTGGLGINPAAVYLASLESERSRYTMLGALGAIADVLFPGQWTRPARPKLPDHPTKEQEAQHRAGLADYRAAYGQYKQRALEVPWAALRFQHVQAIRAKLTSRYAAATVNKRLSALRGVLGAAFDLGLIDAESYQRAVKVDGVKGETLPAGRAITLGELHALMSACMADQSPAGARDAAIIAVLYACGLRRAELASLDLADYDKESGALRVQGKRNKERLAHVVNNTAAALADWLTIRGDEPGALFWSIRRGGHIQRGQRLTPQAVYHILAQRGDQASLKELTPHDLRRSFVGDLLDAGADIATVQRMAGHASVQTTARYDRRPEQAKRKAASLLHVPYRRRTLSDD